MTEPGRDRSDADCCRSWDTAVHEHHRPGVGDFAPELEGFTCPEVDSGTAWSVEL